MLDELSQNLLCALSQAMPSDGFNVVEESELSETGLSGEELFRAMSELEAQGLLEVRYAEGGAYCLRLLPASRGYIERERRSGDEARKKEKLCFLFSMLGAFVGGLLSGGLVLAISLLV